MLRVEEAVGQNGTRFGRAPVGFLPPGMKVLRTMDATTQARSHHECTGALAQPTGHLSLLAQLERGVDLPAA